MEDGTHPSLIASALLLMAADLGLGLFVMGALVRMAVGAIVANSWMLRSLADPCAFARSTGPARTALFRAYPQLSLISGPPPVRTDTGGKTGRAVGPVAGGHD